MTVSQSPSLALDLHEILSLTEIEARITEKFGYPQTSDARQILLLHNGFDEAAAFDNLYQFLNEKPGHAPPAD